MGRYASYEVGSEHFFQRDFHILHCNFINFSTLDGLSNIINKVSCRKLSGDTDPLARAVLQPAHATFIFDKFDLNKGPAQPGKTQLIVNF